MITPCNWAQQLLLTLMVLGVASVNSYKIHPVDSGGVVFNHLGTCLVQRGVVTSRIPTDIDPKADTGHIHQMRYDLRQLLHKFLETNELKNDSLQDAVAMVYQQSRMVDREIQLSTRVNRKILWENNRNNDIDQLRCTNGRAVVRQRRSDHETLQHDSTRHFYSRIRKPTIHVL